MHRFASLILLLGFSTAHASPNSVGYDITELVSATRGAASVKLWNGTRALKAHWNGTQRVIFEDLAPTANWMHPAVIRVVDKAGNDIEKLDVTFPPVGFEKTPTLWGTAFPGGKITDFKLNTFDGALKIKDPEHYYAIFINGMANQRHWNDTSFFYRTLTQIYGYKKENIFVADGVYKESQSDLDGSGEDAIGYGSTQEDIKTMLAEVAEKLQPEDHLLFVVNDHGGSVGGESTISTMDGEMKVSAFVPYFQKFQAERALFMYEQCHSGGFVRPSILKKGWVAMAASRNDESSWGGIDKQYNWDEWIYHTVAAFARQKHDGSTVGTDMKDNHVPAQQAFAYSISSDVARESPLLESRSNKMRAGNAYANGIGVDY